MSKIVDYERLEPIPASYGYAGIVLSVAFFQTLNQVVLRIGCPKAVGRENYWKWRNLVVSWMHALIVGVWDITWYVGCFTGQLTGAPSAKSQSSQLAEVAVMRLNIMSIICRTCIHGSLAKDTLKQ